MLDDNKVQYEYYDVSEDHAKAQEMIQKSGQMGVPVFDIDGQIIVGLNREALKKELGI